MSFESLHLPELKEKTLSDEDLRDLAILSKNLVFEPYEGMKAIEQIQHTQQKLNQKYLSWKEKWTEYSKKVPNLTEKFPKSVKLYGEKFFSEKKEDISPLRKTWQDRVRKMAEASFQAAKGSSEKILQLFREKSIDYIERSFGILVKQDGEEWIVGSAREILARDDLFGYEDIRALDEKSRNLLLTNLYPYSNKTLQKYSERFEYTINLLMGVLVASNLPFTGAVVCFINIVRSIVRSANKIVALSNIYGYPIQSEAALFRLIAKILASFHDGDTNPHHRPLHPEVLKVLYEPQETEEDFRGLLKQIALRDQYIAIPIVGMISVTKINLDDLKIDVYMESLFANYFLWETQKRKHRTEVLDQVTHDLKGVYEELKEKNFLLEKRKEFTMRENSYKKKLLSLPKVHKEELARLHQALVDRALEIYQTPSDLNL